jgi:mannose-1-phosphate guanylyltransferase
MFKARGQVGQVQDVWAVVLAGGVGSRLAMRTRRGDGVIVPKQYCTLWGTRSLLEQTLDRIEPIVAPERTVVVVAHQHEEHWRAQRHNVPDENILEQPSDRGTAMGVLLALMHIRRVDPEAVVVLVPADHGILDESVFRWRLTRTMEEARHGRVVLLGMEPDGADDGYGWIVPGQSIHRDGRLFRVARFVEKPPAEVAEHLRDVGALWSTFILTARLDALLALIARAQPLLFALAVAQLHSTRGFERTHLQAFYDLIPTVDFSRDVLEVLPDWLWVAPTEACGWTDLGTPERLDRFLDAHRHSNVVSLPINHTRRSASQQTIEVRAL